MPEVSFILVPPDALLSSVVASAGVTFEVSTLVESCDTWYVFLTVSSPLLAE